MLFSENPGIVFIFEGAVKDHVMPNGMHLKEAQTNVHIEARVNWDTKDVPDGTAVYCDASGSARRSSSTQSDINILRSYNLKPVTPRKNPPVKDRVNVVPTFTSLSTLMVPPIASTMENEI